MLNKQTINISNLGTTTTTDSDSMTDTTPQLGPRHQTKQPTTASRPQPTKRTSNNQIDNNEKLKKMVHANIELTSIVPEANSDNFWKDKKFISPESSHSASSFLKNKPSVIDCSEASDLTRPGSVKFNDYINVIPTTESNKDDKLFLSNRTLSQLNSNGWINQQPQINRLSSSSSSLSQSPIRNGSTAPDSDQQNSDGNRKRLSSHSKIDFTNNKTDLIDIDFDIYEQNPCVDQIMDKAKRISLNNYTPNYPSLKKNSVLPHSQSTLYNKQQSTKDKMKKLTMSRSELISYFNDDPSLDIDFSIYDEQNNNNNNTKRNNNDQRMSLNLNEINQLSNNNSTTRKLYNDWTKLFDDTSSIRYIDESPTESAKFYADRQPVYQYEYGYDKQWTGQTKGSDPQNKQVSGKIVVNDECSDLNLIRNLRSKFHHQQKNIAPLSANTAETTATATSTGIQPTVLQKQQKQKRGKRLSQSKSISTPQSNQFDNDNSTLKTTKTLSYSSLVTINNNNNNINNNNNNNNNDNKIASTDFIANNSTTASAITSPLSPSLSKNNRQVRFIPSNKSIIDNNSNNTQNEQKDNKIDSNSNSNLNSNNNLNINSNINNKKSSHESIMNMNHQYNVDSNCHMIQLMNIAARREYNKLLRRIQRRQERVPQIIQLLKKVKSLKERRKLEEELHFLMRKSERDQALINKYMMMTQDEIAVAENGVRVDRLRQPPPSLNNTSNNRPLSNSPYRSRSVNSDRERFYNKLSSSMTNLNNLVSARESGYSSCEGGLESATSSSRQIYRPKRTKQRFHSQSSQLDLLEPKNEQVPIKFEVVKSALKNAVQTMESDESNQWRHRSTSSLQSMSRYQEQHDYINDHFQIDSSSLSPPAMIQSTPTVDNKMAHLSIELPNLSSQIEYEVSVNSGPNSDLNQQTPQARPNNSMIENYNYFNTTSNNNSNNNSNISSQFNSSPLNVETENHYLVTDLARINLNEYSGNVRTVPMPFSRTKKNNNTNNDNNSKKNSNNSIPQVPPYNPPVGNNYQALNNAGTSSPGRQNQHHQQQQQQQQQQHHENKNHLNNREIEYTGYDEGPTEPDNKFRTEYIREEELGDNYHRIYQISKDRETGEMYFVNYLKRIKYIIIPSRSKSTTRLPDSTPRFHDLDRPLGLTVDYIELEDLNDLDLNLFDIYEDGVTCESMIYNILAGKRHQQWVILTKGWRESPESPYLYETDVNLQDLDIFEDVSTRRKYIIDEKTNRKYYIVYESGMQKFRDLYLGGKRRTKSGHQQSTPTRAQQNIYVNNNHLNNNKSESPRQEHQSRRRGHPSDRLRTFSDDTDLNSRQVLLQRNRNRNNLLSSDEFALLDKVQYVEEFELEGVDLRGSVVIQDDETGEPILTHSLLRSRRWVILPSNWRTSENSPYVSEEDVDLMEWDVYFDPNSKRQFIVDEMSGQRFYLVEEAKSAKDTFANQWKHLLDTIYLKDLTSAPGTLPRSMPRSSLKTLNTTNNKIDDKEIIRDLHREPSIIKLQTVADKSPMVFEPKDDAIGNSSPDRGIIFKNNNNLNNYSTKPAIKQRTTTSNSSPSQKKVVVKELTQKEIDRKAFLAQKMPDMGKLWIHQQMIDGLNKKRDMRRAFAKYMYDRANSRGDEIIADENYKTWKNRGGIKNDPTRDANNCLNRNALNDVQMFGYRKFNNKYKKSGHDDLGKGDDLLAFNEYAMKANSGAKTGFGGDDSPFIKGVLTEHFKETRRYVPCYINEYQRAMVPVKQKHLREQWLCTPRYLKDRWNETLNESSNMKPRIIVINDNERMITANRNCNLYVQYDYQNEGVLGANPAYQMMLPNRGPVSPTRPHLITSKHPKRQVTAIVNEDGTVKHIPRPEIALREAPVFVYHQGIVLFLIN
jgi:hypothetical protein